MNLTKTSLRTFAFPRCVKVISGLDLLAVLMIISFPILRLFPAEFHMSWQTLLKYFLLKKSKIHILEKQENMLPLRVLKWCLQMELVLTEENLD